MLTPGAGLPRTGTLSLKMALTKLYGTNCSHFYDVFAGEQVRSVDQVRAETLGCMHVRASTPGSMHARAKGQGACR